MYMLNGELIIIQLDIMQINDLVKMKSKILYMMKNNH